MSRVVHFEIAANSPEKIAAFYQNVFGWEIKKWSGTQDYWLVKTGEQGAPGIDGGISGPLEHFVGTVNTIEVDSLAAAAEKVRAADGQIVTEKSTIPGVGYQIYCKDVEGTLFGLHQNDPQAGMG